MDANNLQYGQIVPSTVTPGYVVLSYIVSVVGCITALELLHRRHHYSGRYNWFLLIGAATAMGGVAIWSMHFIGMSAIVMSDNDSDAQIVYSPSYTIGSLLLAIGIVGVAFMVFSYSDSVSPVQIVLGGIITGSAICGMHYLGQAGMINYRNNWDWRYILGSAVIAVVAATIALGIFFWQKSIWTNALWKRVLCAFALAGAVSLMHWTAILGTSYSWQGGPGPTSGWSKSDAVWVCGALALFCCAVLLSFALLWQYVGRLYAQKAKQVSVALAYWDPEGRIMLNSAGLLPSSKVTRSYIQHSFKDQFDADHPIFSWLFRVSRNWSSVSDIVPYMRQHVRSENGGRSSIDRGTAEKAADPTLSFKELFCVAAHDLAYAADLALKDIGVLYDRIVETGSISPQMRTLVPTTTSKTVHDAPDTESVPRPGVTVGRGQLLFLVRKVNRHDALRLQASGFSFAPVDNVTGDLAHSLQITSGELKPYLDDLSSYHETPHSLSPGVHLACFVLKPKIGGFEVLVRKDLRNLVPSVKLSPGKLDRWQTAFLSAYDDWDVQTLLTHWGVEQTMSKFQDNQKEFVAEMHHAIRQLQRRVGEKLFSKARLVAKPLEGPCESDPKTIEREEQGPPTATVIAFRFMTDIHYVHPAMHQDAFLSTRLFLAQQHCYPGSPDHLVFASHVHRELSSSFAGTDLRNFDSAPSSPINSKTKGLHHKSTLQTLRNMNSPTNLAHSFLGNLRRSAGSPPPLTTTISGGGGDNVSEKHLVPYAADNPFSGVHVSSEIEVKVTDASMSGSNSPTTPGANGRIGSFEMSDLCPIGGMRTEIGVGKMVERESMMDTLMGVTLGKAAHEAH